MNQFGKILPFVVVYLSFVVVLVKCVPSVSRRSPSQESQKTICEFEGCTCTNTTWIRANCTFNSSQTVVLESSSVPINLIEFFVSGGYELIIRSNTFVSATGFNSLMLSGTKKISLERNALHYINSSTMFFKANDCDKIVIETNAFKSTQSPISSEIINCQETIVHNAAFSRLVLGVFQNIKNLQLAEGAFIFENQVITQRHGAVGNITIYQSKINKIPYNAFASVISEVNIINSEIGIIDTGAFNTNEISSISFINSTIKRISKEAFTEKMLITHLQISKCQIGSLQSRAIVAGGISNITVYFSTFAEIFPGAINTTVANVAISDNEMAVIHGEALFIKNWNTINFNDNHLRVIEKDFLNINDVNTKDIKEFTFKGNYIYKPSDGSLSFVKLLEDVSNNVFVFDNNAFIQECTCFQHEWMTNLTNSRKIDIVKSSFCNVTSVLAFCFQIEKSLINMENFTILVCNNEENLHCMKYHGETKIIETTATMIIDDYQEEDNNSYTILVITIGSLIIIAILGTLVILSIRAGLWLKRKGYCAHFRNLPYNQQNESSLDDEGAMVPEEPPTGNELPEELTQELLQTLRAQLENPQTHQQAREMIERLYETFVIEDSYTNNNTQDETHLYEELGNLQLNRAPTEEKELNTEITENGAINYLKMMEDKINQPINNLDIEPKKEERPPALVNLYSEPQDTTVHLYSELNQKLNGVSNTLDGEKKGSLKSSGSGSMAFRPLPAKPAEAGPSSQY